MPNLTRYLMRVCLNFGRCDRVQQQRILCSIEFIATSKHRANTYRALEWKNSCIDRTTPVSTTKTQSIQRVVSNLESYSYNNQNSEIYRITAQSIAPKPPSAEFRFVVNLWSISLATEPTVWLKPHLDSGVLNTEYSKCFAIVDNPLSIWFLALTHPLQIPHAFHAETKM